MGTGWSGGAQAYVRHTDELDERLRKMTSTVHDLRTTSAPLRRLPSDRMTLATLRRVMAGHMRAVIIDRDGNVTDAVIPRRRLCREQRIAQRDLRTLDPDLGLGTESLVVLVRSGRVVFSMSDPALSIKALIGPEQVHLFRPPEGRDQMEAFEELAVDLARELREPALDHADDSLPTNLSTIASGREASALAADDGDDERHNGAGAQQPVGSSRLSSMAAGFAAAAAAVVGAASGGGGGGAAASGAVDRKHAGNGHAAAVRKPQRQPQPQQHAQHQALAELRLPAPASRFGPRARHGVGLRDISEGREERRFAAAHGAVPAAGAAIGAAAAAAAAAAAEREAAGAGARADDGGAHRGSSHHEQGGERAGARAEEAPAGWPAAADPFSADGRAAGAAAAAAVEEEKKEQQRGQPPPAVSVLVNEEEEEEERAAAATAAAHLALAASHQCAPALAAAAAQEAEAAAGAAGGGGAAQGGDAGALASQRMLLLQSAERALAQPPLAGASSGPERPRTGDLPSPPSPSSPSLHALAATARGAARQQSAPAPNHPPPPPTPTAHALPLPVPPSLSAVSSAHAYRARAAEATAAGRGALAGCGGPGHEGGALGGDGGCAAAWGGVGGSGGGGGGGPGSAAHEEGPDDEAIPFQCVVLELLFLLVTERMERQVADLALLIGRALSSLRAHVDMRSIDEVRHVKGQLATVDIRIGELHAATQRLLDDELALAGIVGALPGQGLLDRPELRSRTSTRFADGPRFADGAQAAQLGSPFGQAAHTPHAQQGLAPPQQGGQPHHGAEAALRRAGAAGGGARPQRDSCEPGCCAHSPQHEPCAVSTAAPTHASTAAASPRPLPLYSPHGGAHACGSGGSGALHFGSGCSAAASLLDGQPMHRQPASLSRADSHLAPPADARALSEEEARRLVALRNARLVGDMLEVVLKHVVQTKAKIDKLGRTIEDTEELIRLQLDLTRNEMLKLEMLLTIGTFCAGIGAVIVGIFGMNLASHFEEHPSMFYVVCSALALILVLTFALLWAFAHSRGLL